jgi:hypothetical protein
MKSWIASSLIALCIVGPSSAVGQSPDTSATVLRTLPSLQTPTDTRPPISPRRAFLSSFILPGYGQSRLDRPSAAMLFSTIEVFSLGMAAKSAHDLRDVKSIPRDSVVSTYKTDPLTGLVVRDPKTGNPIPATFIKSRFDGDRVKARRTHYEDWIAALIFNHLFAGADAYVAANLWDFRANVAASATPTSARIGATLTW